MTDLSIRARKSNPFDSTLARVNSNYAAYHDGELVRPLAPHLAPSALAEQVHGSFRDHVLDSDFSCVGAKSAISRGSYRLGQYGTLASAGATAGLACDLYEFVRDQASGFSTFLASFADRFDRMQAVIRERELALQGSLNANLSNFGEQSEARQYSGRRVEVGWRCPFSPRNSIR